MGNICPRSGSREIVGNDSRRMQPETGHGNEGFSNIRDENPTTQDPGVREGNDLATLDNQPRAIDNDYIAEKAMKARHDNQGSASMSDNVPTTQEPSLRAEFVALFDHVATDEGDLSFSRGDVMVSSDNSSDNWFHVTKKSGGSVGFIPKNHVAKNGDITAKPWYHGDVTGLEAKVIVLDPDRKEGDFLVRKSQTRENQHSLTLLGCDEDGVRRPLHYRIVTDDDRLVYISKLKRFHSLSELIDYYIGTKECLPCHLRCACPRPKPPLPDLSSKWKNKFEISRDSIRLHGKLGTGNYGEVWKGMWDNSVEVAVKKAKTDKLSNKTFLKEAEIMKTLQHPNIVRLYGICSDDPVYIVTELMEKGSLLDFLRDDKGPGPTLPKDELIDIAVQVARGMAYIEEKKLIHRDLAARNVLVSQTLVVKIADFGLARAIEDDEYTSSGSTFPVKWTALEALNYKKFSIKSDVWAFGILLVEIITHGGHPYPGIDNKEIQGYLQSRLHHSQPYECPNDLYDIMRDCWNHTPSERPGFADLEKYLLDLSFSAQDRVPVIQQRASETTLQDKKILVAQFDFQSTASGDLSFAKGDRFERVNGGSWPLVVHLKTGKRGYVPGNYVAEENSADCYTWFQPDVSKSEVNHLLTAEGNEQGVFLIRAASAPNKQYPLVLAVLCQGKVKAHVVKSYRIGLDESEKYFIENTRKFETLQSLVTHYRENSGLYCALTEPCQRVSPVVPDLSSQTQDSFEIPREILVKLDKLGSGNFGEVWKGVWNGRVPVAIKCAKPHVISPGELLQEAATMKTLIHKNLVRLYGICSDEPIFIVTELVRHGDLRSYLRSEKKEGRSLAFQDRLDMAQQVVQAMTYLESKKFVHRDLAARNILVGDNQVVKVADFGLARALIDDAYIAHGSSFPLKWTALEGILKNAFSSKSDVWSFGIVLVEIVTEGEEPYPDWTHGNLVDKLKRGERHPQPKNCPVDLYEIMKTCWEDTAKRPSFEEIQTLLHNFLAHYED